VQRAVAPPAAPSKMNRLPLRAEFESVLLDEGMNLSEAERYYRDALKLDPGYSEARIRLARVLSLRNRHADALALLQEPVESPEPHVRFYAALALGVAAEGTQKPGVAREAYERALALFPTAQSPLLALMRLARERPDDDAAKVFAARFALLGPNENGRLDPWWDYFDCHGRNRTQELERLWSLYRTTEER
jgi:tetratricopeptide (TPR) repeat protein